jgi:lipoprotein-anchoring transpeptidase ErfK/SrfK
MRRVAASTAVLAALLWAGTASAGVVSPQFVVSSPVTTLSARGAMTIDLRVSDGMTGAVVVYVPAGFAAQLGRSAGTAVGTVPSAVAQVGDADVALAGSVYEADPATLSGSSCPSGAHAAVWTLQLSGPGVDLSVPVVLDAAGMPESAYSSYRLELCPGDARVRELTVRLDGVFETPGQAGAFVWRAVTSTDGAGPEVELRSTMPLPVTLSLTGRYDAASKAARLYGALTAGGGPVVGAPVVVSGSRGKSMQEITDSRGRFEVARRISAATRFRASTSVGPADVTASGCGGPIAAGGCIGAVVSPFSTRSRAVRIAPPREPTLRLGSRGPSVRRLQERLIALRYLPWGSASAVFDERTWHAVVAFQGWQGVGRDGVVAARIWRALERARVPTAPGGFERGLVVDTSRQVMLLVAGGRVQRAIHVSTAAPGHWTPHGQFRIFRKEILSWSIPFEAWMPYANYFTGGFAIHGFASVPAYAASHGCIRVPMVEAPGVYSFAGYGTTVLVR